MQPGKDQDYFVNIEHSQSPLEVSTMLAGALLRGDWRMSEFPTQFFGVIAVLPIDGTMRRACAGLSQALG